MLSPEILKMSKNDKEQIESIVKDFYKAGMKALEKLNYIFYIFQYNLCLKEALSARNLTIRGELSKTKAQLQQCARLDQRINKIM